MKKFLLISAVIIIIACVLSLLYALLNMNSYHNLRDGSAEHYNRLYKRAIIYFIVGIVFAVIGAVCVVYCFKL